MYCKIIYRDAEDLYIFKKKYGIEGNLEKIY